MEQDTINEHLKNENAALRQQLGDAINQINLLQNQNADCINQIKLLQDQNATLVNKNCEIIVKLDEVLKNQAVSNTTSVGKPNLTNNKNKRVAEHSANINAKSSKLDLSNGNSSNSTDGSDDKLMEQDDASKLPDDGNSDNIRFTSWADASAENNGVADVDQNRGKPTPIQLRNYDDERANDIYRKIKNKFGDANFKWRQLNTKSPARIYCNDFDTNERISSFLADGGVEFNSYAQSKDKKHAFIISGLTRGNHRDNIRHIENAFITHGITGNVDVSVFETGKMKRDGVTSAGLYKVVVENGSDLKNIITIKQIANFHVKIERMKKSNTVQCHNCQRFNHTSNQCNFKYRCVQCVMIHPPRGCPRKNNCKLPLGCVNCGEHKLNFAGHTANNLRACDFYKTLITKSASLAAKPIKITPTGTSGPGGPGTSTRSAGGPSTENINSNRTKKSNGGDTRRYNDILEDVRANNPGLSNTKTNKLARKKQYGIENKRKSTQSSNTISSGGDLSLISNNNKLVGGLIADLLSLLHKYT